MTQPQDALAQARDGAAELRARGAYGEATPIRPGPPPGGTSDLKLYQWALIEPDTRDVRSTRGFGAPITALKRLLLRLLVQYHMQLTGEQTRFNVALLGYVEASSRSPRRGARSAASASALATSRRMWTRDRRAPRVIRVHQLLSGAGPARRRSQPRPACSAATSRVKVRGLGGGTDHAFRISPGLGGAITPADRLDAPPEDILLLHHSAGWPALERLLALPNRKLLLYHNVTPATLVVGTGRRSSPRHQKCAPGVSSSPSSSARSTSPPPTPPSMPASWPCWARSARP